MRLMSFAVCAILLGILSGSAAAEPLAKGSKILAIQVSEGIGDFVTPESFDPGFITAYHHSEIGGLAQFWYLFSEKWAFNIGGGLGYFKETNKPGTNAPPADSEFVYTQKSWNVRTGIERVVSISNDVHLFIGPGVQVWSGHGEFEDGSSKIKAENTLRVALSGRLGGHISLGSTVGLMGHLGFYMGVATADDQGAEATLWPSGQEGALGLAFNF